MSRTNNIPGDRFIPNRSFMDIDRCIGFMSPMKPSLKPKSSASSNFSEAYRKRIDNAMNTDSEGRPFKMLVFRGGKKVSDRSVFHHIDFNDQIYETEKNIKNINPPRSLSKSAYRVLDAPGINDDFNLNLIDWGSNNMLVVALDSELYMLNANDKSNEILMEADHDYDYLTSVVWSESATKVAVGLSSSQLQIWDAETMQMVRSLQGHNKRVGCLAWKGHTLTSGSKDKSIINHDVRMKNSMASRLRAHTDEVCGLKWSNRGNQLASSGNDGTICIWEATSMGSSSRSLKRLTEHSDVVKAIAWCPYQSDILVSGGGAEDCCIKIWNSQNGKCTKSINTESAVSGLEWNEHDKEILSSHGGPSNQLSLWRYPSMSKIADLKGHEGDILGLSQNPDGSAVVSSGADEALRFWNVFEPPKTKKTTDIYSPLSLTKFHIR